MGATFILTVSSQIGLIISPFIIGKGIIIRVIGMLLLLPFTYLILAHDVSIVVTRLIASDEFSVRMWELNRSAYWLETGIILLTGLIYLFTFVCLLFKSKTVRFNALQLLGKLL